MTEARDLMFDQVAPEEMQKAAAFSCLLRSAEARGDQSDPLRRVHWRAAKELVTALEVAADDIDACRRKLAEAESRFAFAEIEAAALAGAMKLALL